MRCGLLRYLSSSIHDLCCKVLALMLDYPTECVLNRRIITLHEMMVDETNGERRLPLKKLSATYQMNTVYKPRSPMVQLKKSSDGLGSFWSHTDGSTANNGYLSLLWRRRHFAAFTGILITKTTSEDPRGLRCWWALKPEQRGYCNGPMMLSATSESRLEEGRWLSNTQTCNLKEALSRNNGISKIYLCLLMRYNWATKDGNVVVAGLSFPSKWTSGVRWWNEGALGNSSWLGR